MTTSEPALVTGERRSTGRDVLIGIIVSLLAGGLILYWFTPSGRDRIDGMWSLPLTFVGMGLAGSFWWWRTKGSWSLAFILLIDLLVFSLIALAIVRSAIFGVATLFLLPIMLLLMFIGAKLGYWTRDYIEYRWGE